MGLYINPKDCGNIKLPFFINASEIGEIQKITKEQATSIQTGKDGNFVVFLVNNGPFQAAAIAFDEGELSYFLRPDPREIAFFLCSIEWIKKVDPGMGKTVQRFVR